MSFKQSRSRLNGASLSTQGHKNTTRHRKSSSAQTVSQSQQQDPGSSSTAILEQGAPLGEAPERPLTRNNEDVVYSDHLHDSKSHPKDSPSESESDSELDSSPSPPERSYAETIPIHAPLATSPRIHPLLASLRSSSSRSPSRPGLSRAGGSFLSSPHKSPPHLAPPAPLPPHLAHLSPTRSRAATPTESDTDRLSNSTNTQQQQPHATQRQAAHSVPSHEYYGFALYISSLAALIIYILWSFLPHAALHALGIEYYPSRWWSLAGPAWIVMAIGFVYVALALYNIEYLTLPLRSLATVVDEVSVVAVLDGEGRIVRRGMLRDEFERKQGWNSEWRAAWSLGTDAVLDVPVGGVCEVLYGDG